MPRRKILENRAKTQLWVGVALRKTGSQKLLAYKLGASQQAVSQWLRGEAAMEYRFCTLVARLCGCKASDIRPDVFDE